MEIKIPFNDWSKQKLAEEKKCATSRRTKYGEKGDIFTINGKKYQKKS